MAESSDFYSILGIQRDADEAEIKRAYRKAALQWHADKNPTNKEQAEVMFKQVAEAYEVLSNPQKRAQYDRGGKEALNGGMGGYDPGNVPFTGPDPFRIFEQFFGGRNPFDDASNPSDNGFFHGGFGNFHTTSSPFGAFGGMGGTSVFASSNMGIGASTFTSTSTTTRIVNGSRVTVTETTVRKPDGTTETTRNESSDGGGAGVQQGSLFSSFPMLNPGMMFQQSSMPGMMMQSSGGHLPETATPENYTAQVEQLKTMGFNDETACLQALRSANGDVNQAVTTLIGG